MAAKWKVSQLKIGKTMETTFFVNPVASSSYRFRATHLDGRRVRLRDELVAGIRAGGADATLSLTVLRPGHVEPLTLTLRPSALEAR